MLKNSSYMKKRGEHLKIHRVFTKKTKKKQGICNILKERLKVCSLKTRKDKDVPLLFNMVLEIIVPIIRQGKGVNSIHV
jgi:hypothetical protein